MHAYLKIYFYHTISTSVALAEGGSCCNSGCLQSVNCKMLQSSRLYSAFNWQFCNRMWNGAIQPNFCQLWLYFISASECDAVHVIMDRHVITGQNDQSTLCAVQNLILLCNGRWAMNGCLPNRWCLPNRRKTLLHDRIFNCNLCDLGVC